MSQSCILTFVIYIMLLFSHGNFNKVVYFLFSAVIPKLSSYPRNGDTTFLSRKYYADSTDTETLLEWI